VALQKNLCVRIALVGTHPAVHALVMADKEPGLSTHRCQGLDTLAAAHAHVEG
jgi:hypothetical protein